MSSLVACNEAKRCYFPALFVNISVLISYEDETDEPRDPEDDDDEKGG